MKFNDPGRVVRHRGGVYLKSPHYGQVKLNCDASVNMDEKKVVVGGVLRNHNGAFIFAFAANISFCWMLHAELWQSLLGLV